MTNQLAARASAEHTTHQYFEVPRIAVTKFFGRQQLLQELDQCFWLHENQHRPNVVVLWAMGGQGKSQLALEYCRQQRETFRGVFWVDATSQATTERDFQSILLTISPLRAQSLSDIRSKIKFLLDTLEGWKDRWLMVFDNFDDPGSFPDLNEFIPISE